MLASLLFLPACRHAAETGGKTPPSGSRSAPQERISVKPVRERPVFEVGRPAPQIVLPALDEGRPLSLAGLLGRKVLLLVFASW